MAGDFKGNFLKLTNSDIKISLDKVAQEKQKSAVENEKFQKIFDFFDKDKNKTLSPDEIAEMLELLTSSAMKNGNMEIEDDEADEFLNNIKNSDGKSLKDESIEINEIFGFVKSLETDNEENIEDTMSLPEESEEALDELEKSLNELEESLNKQSLSIEEYRTALGNFKVFRNNEEQNLLSPEAADMLTALHSQSPALAETLFNSLITPDPTTFQLTSNLNDSEIMDIIKNYTDNIKLGERLLSEQTLNFVGNPTNRFNGTDINEILKNYSTNPELAERLLSEESFDLFSNITRARFTGTEIGKLLKTYSSNPDLAERLLSEKSFSFFSGKSTARFNGHEISEILETYSTDPELAERLLSENKRFNGHEISEILKTYSNNPELAERLFTEQNNDRPRFNGHEISGILKTYSNNPELAERLFSERITYPDNSSAPRYSGTTIETILKYYNDYQEFTERLLSEQITYSDGYSTPRFESSVLNKILENYSKSPKFVENLISKKTVDIDGNDIYRFDSYQLDKILSSYEQFFNMTSKQNTSSDKSNIIDTSEFVSLIADNYTNNSNISFSKQSQDNGYYQVTIDEDTNLKKKTIDFKINEDNTLSFVSIEDSQQKEDVLTTQKEYADGTKIETELYAIGNANNEEKQQGYKKTFYDSNGNKIRTEEVIPSEEIPGEYTINEYNYKKGKPHKETIGSIKTSSNTERTRIRKRLTSSDGTVTRETKITNKNGFGSTYTILDKDGNELFHTKRSLTKIDDNHYRSVVDGQNYDVKFENGTVTAAKLDKKGNVTDTVTLDSKVLDPELTDLFKQLTGDYFFKIKACGLNKIVLSDDVGKDNACYTHTPINSIFISKELKNDAFVFTHELGHALDFTILQTMNTDPEFVRIWEEELAAYKSNSGDAEATTISYFTDKTMGRKENSAKEECIAEAHALISGVQKTDSATILGTRSIVLQQHFPRLIAYAAKAFQNPEEYLAKRNQDNNTFSG